MFKDTELERKVRTAKIESMQQEGKTKQVLALMETDEFSYSLEWRIKKAKLYLEIQQYGLAEKVLEEVRTAYELEVEFYYWLGICKEGIHDEKGAAKCYVQALDSAEKAGDADGRIRTELSDRILNLVVEKGLEKSFIDQEIEEQRLRGCAFHKAFPYRSILKEGEYWLSTCIGSSFYIGKEAYFSGIYDHYFEEREQISLYQLSLNTKRCFFCSEVIKAQIKKNIEFRCQERGVAALMPLSKNQQFTIGTQSVTINPTLRLPNRYYYYLFEKGDYAAITSQQEFAVGEFWPLVQKGSRPRLILNLFVDGLAKKITEQYGFAQCMPYTYKFFSKGTICQNAYTNAEWTQPSVASFFSGRRLTEHRMFHPEYSSENLYQMELFPEILEREGYLCAKIDGDWRSTPIMGYAKGMKRVLFQPSVMAMHSDGVLTEAMEHLEAFKDADDFLWICLPDLHDIADEFEMRTSIQTAAPLQFRELRHTEETSVRKGFDKAKIERLKMELRRMDTLLSSLYFYIESNYQEEEYIISMMSDHGQGYLIPEGGEFLDEGRTKVTMMFRGRNIPTGQCTSLMESVDLFPVLLNAAGIKEFDLKDGNIPIYFGGTKDREYALSESIFPGSPYHCSLNYENEIFYFSSGENCSKSGRFYLNEYTVKLVDKADGEEIKDEEKIAECTEIVLEHVKQFVIG